MRCFGCQFTSKKRGNDYECVYMPQCLMEDVERRLSYEKFELRMGNKIKFSDSRYWWEIITRNERYLICVRKIKGIYFYTICDLHECIRGKDNFNPSLYNYEEKEEADKALKDLEEGKLEISYRNWMELEISEEK